MNYMVLVAGGQGLRADLHYNKIFATLGHFPLIYWSLALFQEHAMVDKIIISLAALDIPRVQRLIKKHAFSKVCSIVPAGESRQASILEILETLNAKAQDLIGIHNAANPLVLEQEITAVMQSASIHGAALLAQQETDTLKITDDESIIKRTISRQNIWHAQTPQTALFAYLSKAYQLAKIDGFTATDDSQLLERIHIYPKIVPTSAMNFKITFKKDLILARELFPEFKNMQANKDAKNE